MTLEMRRALIIAAFVPSSCYVDSMYPPVFPRAREDTFGYVTAGLQVHVDYRGDLDLEVGTGWRVSVPPLVPFVFITDIALVGGMMALAASAQDVGVYVELGDGLFLIPPDDPAVWTSGMRDASALLSEVSWELSAESSYHGRDSAFRLLAGLKVATNRKSSARVYGCGGWSWHWIDMAEAGDIFANGPYGGVGIEFFSGPTGCVGLDGRWHWVWTKDKDYETNRLLTVELSWSVHW